MIKVYTLINLLAQSLLLLFLEEKKNEHVPNLNMPNTPGSSMLQTPWQLWQLPTLIQVAY